MALVLVSHDLGVIAHNTDRLLVMYAGEIVEQGNSKEVMARPTHPYTEGLLKCPPGMHTEARGLGAKFRLPTITGIVPNLADRPEGCQLHPRCSYKVSDCEKHNISLQILSGKNLGEYPRQVRCIKPLSAEVP